MAIVDASASAIVPPSSPQLRRRRRRSPQKSPPPATCDIHRIRAPAARRDARVRVDDDDDDVDGVRADAQDDDDDDNDNDDVVQCGMRQCAPIDQLVDGVGGGGGGGIEGGGAWGMTVPSEGRCHGRMSVVTSVLPRREGDPIRRMKTTIIAGGDAARSAVAFRRDDGLRTMPPIIQPQTQQSNYGSEWRGRVKSQCL
jgi:hypothetical protein